VPDEKAAEARKDAQSFALGALSVLLVDVRCRGQLLVLSPSLGTLLHATSELEGYDDIFQAARRADAAKVLTSCIQRDGFVRQRLVEQGQLTKLLELLEAEGPGADRVRFCMASALATIILDENVMSTVKERGEASIMFVHSIRTLKSALRSLAANSKTLPLDAELTVRMAEATSQAMWGAAYYCTLPGGGGVEQEHVVVLSEMAVSTWCNSAYALGRVAHCIAATLASLASNAECAAVLMSNDEAYGVVAAIMLLVKVHDRGVFEHSGHVRAAAACALSFLACHNIGALGDDCLTGPYRKMLLQHGALVRSPLAPQHVLTTAPHPFPGRWRYPPQLWCLCVRCTDVPPHPSLALPLSTRC
jgi:hypothetical protein